MSSDNKAYIPSVLHTSQTGLTGLPTTSFNRKRRHYQFLIYFKDNLDDNFNDNFVNRKY